MVSTSFGTGCCDCVDCDKCTGLTALEGLLVKVLPLGRMSTPFSYIKRLNPCCIETSRMVSSIASMLNIKHGSAKSLEKLDCELVNLHMCVSWLLVNIDPELIKD